MLIERSFRCPSCGTLVTFSGNAGDSQVIICPSCGSQGRIAFPYDFTEVAATASHLKKTYSSLVAVDDISFSIKKGEIYGFLGPNGSGKTTLIKMLCGLLRPTAGEAMIFGTSLPCKTVMNDIGYMPQDIAVYLDNTVHENLQFFAGMYGMSKERFHAREQEVLKFIDLMDRRDTMISTLSGGMRHRVSLACALIHEPRLLFLDEPTVGVDPELRVAFWNYFNVMAKKGITVVITTHYMDEADHCSRVALLRQGRLIAEGSPYSLKSKTGTRTLEDAFLSLSGQVNP